MRKIMFVLGRRNAKMISKTGAALGAVESACARTELHSVLKESIVAVPSIDFGDSFRILNV